MSLAKLPAVGVASNMFFFKLFLWLSALFNKVSFDLSFCQFLILSPRNNLATCKNFVAFVRLNFV